MNKMDKFEVECKGDDNAIVCELKFGERVIADAIIEEGKPKLAIRDKRLLREIVELVKA